MRRGSVILTRTVSFSSGHRYWNSSESLLNNKATFGAFASPFNHGHNYVLDVSISGPVTQDTGMVVNIKRLDDLLQERIVSVYDQKSLNDEVETFLSTPPTVENIISDIRRRISIELESLGDEVAIEVIRLQETPSLWGTWKTTMNQLTLTRKYEFAASHRLHAPQMSDEENLQLFGKCNNPAGHGHNYELEVSVSGPVDPNSGMIADLTVLDSLVNQLVVDRYDHKHLNADLPEFKDGITTSECVAQEIFRRLEGKLPADLEGVILRETARNAFEVRRA